MRLAFAHAGLHDCAAMPEPSNHPPSDPFLPRLRAGLSVVPGDGETMVFSPRLESLEAIEDPEGVWAALLAVCDGTTGVEGLPPRLAPAGVELSPSELAEGVEALVAGGFLVDASVDLDDEWSNQRAYIEQLTRGDLDVVRAQERVRSTRALVLGAGGTGSWLALSLAMMGVAELIVVDPDVVEDRNRTRQPYARAAVGRRKVEVLGEIVTGLRPGIAFAGVDLRVDQVEDLSSLVRGVDVVACCADEPSLDVISAIVARACVPAGVPHVICGYRGATGRVGPFWYPRRRAVPCAGCLSIDTDGDAGSVGSRGGRTPMPVSVAQPQLVAAVAASEILHLRAGIRPATTGKLFALDSLTLGSSRSRVPLRSDCPICFGGRKRRLAASSSATV
jgi:bacteriocin biosynthesis cyclodehydratase domain-containing protein